MSSSYRCAGFCFVFRLKSIIYDEIPNSNVGIFFMKEIQTSALKAFLNQTHQDIFDDKSGTPADYIPELAIVNPDQFGIAITTSDGFTNEVGDASIEFTIQSISKAFVYSLALELLGTDKVLKTIGIEPYRCLQWGAFSYFLVLLSTIKYGFLQCAHTYIRFRPQILLIR